MSRKLPELPFPRVRHYGGRRYTLLHTYSGKDNAQRAAQTLRTAGVRTRVEKIAAWSSTNSYALYVCKEGFRKTRRWE